jgi:hypothetical protein
MYDDYNKTSLTTGNEMIKHGKLLLDLLKSTTKSLETLLADCVDFVDYVEEDLSTPQKGDFVYSSKNGMLSYIGRDFIEVINKKQVKESKKIVKVQSIDKCLIKEINYKIKLPIINDIKDMPIALNFYKGCDKYPAGIYLNLFNNVVRVPFPDIIDLKKEFDRKHSIRCKYGSLKNCLANRTKNSKMFNSEIRECNFAHEGDTMVKIGHQPRCPGYPSFGNPKTLIADIDKINIDDIKNLLMYGLHDIISAVVWLDYKKINTPFIHLDKY